MPPCSEVTGVDRGKLLSVIQSLVGNGDYHYSSKVRRVIEDGYYGTEDLERCILTATSIRNIEVDELGTATDGHKYTILGRDTYRHPFYTCGKIVLSQNDQRLYFFITAHEAN